MKIDDVDPKIIADFHLFVRPHPPLTDILSSRIIRWGLIKILLHPTILSAMIQNRGHVLMVVNNKPLLGRGRRLYPGYI